MKQLRTILLVLVACIFTAGCVFLYLEDSHEKIDIVKVLKKQPDDAVIILFDMVCEKSNYGDAIHKLTTAEKTLYLTLIFDGEINNGGFWQFFINSSGDYTYETLESLKQIGAEQAAGLLQTAITAFPGGIVPADRSQREMIIDETTDGTLSIWYELDRTYYQNEEDIEGLNYSYAKANFDEY